MTNSIFALPAKLARNIRGRFTGVWLGDAHHDFIKYSRDKWQRPGPINPHKVILAGLTSHPPSICAYSYLMNFLADKADAAMECYWFGKGDTRQTEALYESFGARLTLGWPQTEKYRSEAESFAESTWLALRSKEDVFRISIDGIVIGELIHDTYLRMEFLTQASPMDVKLRDYIGKAFIIVRACQEYFDTHKVIAFVPRDPGFLECSIPQKICVLRKVPIYTVPYAPFSLMRADEEFRSDDIQDHRSWPSKVGAYARFRERFAAFPNEVQDEALTLAREKLNAYLNGKINPVLIPSGHSAYSQGSEKRILSTSKKPKILILLHDMCDCPNIYRWMLFPDFNEWISYLLDKAVTTEFEWYVKPHPHSHSKAEVENVNQEFFNQLKAQYPEIHFLGKNASNRQIIDEGIVAMFTIHGSATSEFAYLGIPVVTAGDHPCVDYGFTLNASTLEMYEKFIRSADALKIEVRKRDIEEFYYMWNLHFQSGPDRVNLIPDDWVESPRRSKLEAGSDVFRQFVSGDSPRRDELVSSYLEETLQVHDADPFLTAKFN